MRATVRVLWTLLLLGLVPAVAAADDVLPNEMVQVLNNLSPRYGNGGPFTINDLGIGATDIDFPTFCLEQSEVFSPGGSYYAGLELDPVTGVGIAIAGGAGGGSPDPISKLTAYLYQSFRAGQLFGYTQDVFQHAFWCEENEEATCGTGTSARALLDAAALAMSTDSNTNWQTNANFRSSVKVLNLYTAQQDLSKPWNERPINERAQSMLIWDDPNNSVLVPEPTSLFLLGSGLLGLATVARRRRMNK